MSSTEILRLGRPFEISRENDRLRRLCSALYQVCGAHGASAAVLDALSQASAGGYDGEPEELLPYTPDETCYDSGVNQGTAVPHPRVEKSYRTEYRVWLEENAGYIVVRPWPEIQDGTYEVCTEDTEDSEGYLGKCSFLLSNAAGARALGEVLLEVADTLAAAEQSDNP
jgi:hypothetical protein